MPLAFLFLAGVSTLIPARWNASDPKSLELLRGGPVNCILLETPHWNRALIEAARQRRVASFGVVGPGGDGVARARQALANGSSRQGRL